MLPVSVPSQDCIIRGYREEYSVRQRVVVVKPVDTFTAGSERAAGVMWRKAKILLLTFACSEDAVVDCYAVSIVAAEARHTSCPAIASLSPGSEMLSLRCKAYCFEGGARRALRE